MLHEIVGIGHPVALHVRAVRILGIGPPVVAFGEEVVRTPPALRLLRAAVTVTGLSARYFPALPRTRAPFERGQCFGIESSVAFCETR